MRQRGRAAESNPAGAAAFQDKGPRQHQGSIVNEFTDEQIDAWSKSVNELGLRE
jgi:hypothetical protein